MNGPVRDRILARYLLETPLELEAAVAIMASEASTGTFVPVPGESPELVAQFGMRLEQVTPATAPLGPVLRGPTPRGAARCAEVTVSLPLALTGLDLVAMLASLAGNLSELREVTRLRLLDVELPAELIAAQPGPAASVDGVRAAAGVASGPLRAAIAALEDNTPVPQSDLRLDSVVAADPPAAPLAARLECAARWARERPGLTAVTITDSVDRMREHAARVAEVPNTALQIALGPSGLPAVATLRGHTQQLPIIGCPSGHGVHGRAAGGGIAFPAWQTLWRMAGVDVLPVTAGARAEACLVPLATPGDRALPMIGPRDAAPAGHDFVRLT